MKRKVLITGAAGGMGRACARLFGAAHPLVLTDRFAEPLERFAGDLRGEGIEVVSTHCGDLDSDEVLSRLTGELAGDSPFTLIHTAGIAPSQGDWQAMITTNMAATHRLVDRVQQQLSPGSVAILIASNAGHMLAPDAEIAAILDDPVAPDLIERIRPVVERLAHLGGPTGDRGIAYSLAKQAVIRMCERHAPAWGRKGARIVSISPGVIMTPMSLREMEMGTGATEVRDSAPAGRVGRAMDIAFAARFLASDEASFITGSDLRVDGGSTAVFLHPPAAK